MHVILGEMMRKLDLCFEVFLAGERIRSYEALCV